MGIDEDYENSLKFREKERDRELKRKEHAEKVRFDNEKLRIEIDKINAAREDKERQIEEHRKRDDIKYEHIAKMWEQKEDHDFEMLKAKQDYEDKVRLEEKRGEIIVEKTKGLNEIDRITHEASIRIQEKQLSEKFLESEVERDVLAHHLKTEDEVMKESAKIFLQETLRGLETRKTISLQAKLAQQGVDKDKIKGWVKDANEESED